MIEKAQNAIVTVLKAGLETNLAALRTASGLEALALTAPAKYMVNYDPKTCILPMNFFPACLQIPVSSEPEHKMQSGLRTRWRHKIKIVFMLQQVSTKADALTACETLQKQRSRYAEAAIKTLWEGMPSDPIFMVELDEIKYSNTLASDDETRFLGSVWLFVTVHENETL